MKINKEITSVSGRGIPLPGNDLDTDRIIPARFLKCVTFNDLGNYLFYDVRFNTDGSKKEHPLNDEKYKGGAILIVERNFGCGSSREHAPQSILRYGVKAIVGESFAEIFADNCTAIGLPLATAHPEDIANLMNFVTDDPACEIKIDLERQEGSYGDFTIQVKQPEAVKKALLAGTWDSTNELLSAKKNIQALAQTIPYLFQFKKPH